MKHETTEALALKQSSPTFDKVIQATSLVQAAEMNIPSIARMKKERETETKQMMAAIIDRAQRMMNLSAKMNAEQLQDAVNIIAAEYYWMTLADLNAIMTQGRMGRYGELYGRIDITVICGWCEKYLAQRANFYEKQNNSKHNETKRI